MLTPPTPELPVLMVAGASHHAWTHPRALTLTLTVTNLTLTLTLTLTRTRTRTRRRLAPRVDAPLARPPTNRVSSRRERPSASRWRHPYPYPYPYPYP